MTKFITERLSAVEAAAQRKGPKFHKAWKGFFQSARLYGDGSYAIASANAAMDWDPEKCQHCFRDKDPVNTTCLRSECQEAEFIANRERNAPKCRKCGLPRIVSFDHNDRCTWNPRNRGPRPERCLVAPEVHHMAPACNLPRGHEGKHDWEVGR